MPIVWQHTSTKKDPKCLLMPSQKQKSLTQHSNSWQWSAHPPQLMWCQTKRIAVSSVRNQDISHNIALTLGAMSVIWSYYHGLPTQNTSFRDSSDTTNHTKVTMPDWIWGTTMKIDTDKANPGHSPTIEDIVARHCDLHRGCSRSQHQDRHSHHRSSSHWSCSAHRGHNHRPHCHTPHQSHCRLSKHWSPSGYWSQDHSRSHSWSPYRSSRHEAHQSDSYSSRMRRRPHPKKNMKVKIEDPHTDYYSSGGHYSHSGEDCNPFNYLSPLQVMSVMICCDEVCVQIRNWGNVDRRKHSIDLQSVGRLV